MIQHRLELNAKLELHQPDLLALNETQLNDSTPILDIPGYIAVSRRDRPVDKEKARSYGGILVYRRVQSLLISHIEDSTSAERSWHLIHTDLGPILFCNWYRPLGAPSSQIDTFRQEFNRLSVGASGVLVRFHQ